ncbi:MAG TPA: peptidoglycan-binding protein [Candidatus Paceibacterota bacterium]|nr:peptidoglycan-binding protein [Candidatus Paceibacterota bacterium]
MRKFFSAAMFVAVAFTGFSAVAHADVPASNECVNVGSTVVDTTYHIANDPDSGLAGNWALDNFDRHIQIWPEADYFCAKATDIGTFTTTGISPTGVTLSQPITGTMEGAVVVKTMVAPNDSVAPIANPDCSIANECDGLTGKWITYYFNSSVPNSGYSWGWTYAAPTGETWVNADSGNSGDIHPVYNSTAHTGHANLQAAFDAATAGDTVELAGNITTSAQANITKALTLDGNGFTLSPAFTKTDNSNNSAIGILNTSDVTIGSLVIDGTAGINLNGIHAYVSTDVNLNSVTVSNNDHAAVIVNGSTVNVNNITTANNGWGGINVDLGSGVTSPAVLTVTGTSAHTEAGPAIWIDDVTKDVTVNASQYTSSMSGNTRLYVLPAPVTSGASVAITSSSVTPVSVTVPQGVTDAKLDLSTLVTAFAATTPVAITVNADSVDVEIPSGTVITGDSSWDGKIKLPEVATVSVAPSVGAGQTASVAVAIKVGSDTATLTFDKAVRLVLTGQAGKRAGFIPAGGSTFTEITETCVADDQTTANALAAGSECKIDVGSDLVVWTKHFTTFATYSITNGATATANSGIVSARSGGRSSGAGSSISVATTASSAPSIGQVLGAATIRLSTPVSQGMRGDAVVALQERLRAAGFFTFPTSTGYFGPITLAAVKAYQASVDLPVTGYVGSMTIGALNQ